MLVPLQLAPAMAQEAPPAYLDDRSNPQQLIRSLYNAINRHEYGRAFSYFSNPPSPSFEAYEKGFADTEAVELLTGLQAEDAGAGTVHFTLPVAIRSTSTSGDSKVFAGCYTLKLSSPSAQTTPYTPLTIEEGKLRPAEGELEDVLPTRCNSDEPERDSNALLMEEAREAFTVIYGRECEETENDQEGPEHYQLTWRPSYASADSPDEVAHLFRFFCYRGAYNEINVYLMTNEATGTIRPLAFSSPELDIEYEDDDSEKPAKDIRIVGYQTENMLVNSGYDPQTMSITSYSKWRGLGDASSSGTWLFRQGQFTLVKFEVDPSYDGEIEPVTVLDYEEAP